MVSEPQLLTEGQRTPVTDSFHFSTVPEHTGIAPLHVSTFAGYERGRAEFLAGAEALGLNSTRKPILAQQYVVADCINAERLPGVPAFIRTAIVIGRRASKTTSVFAVALGRMMHREDYQVAFTSITQVEAQRRWKKDVVEPIQRRFPDPETSPWHIIQSAGNMFIQHKPTGSRMSVVGPSSGSFIGNAFDLILVDEAQVIGPGEPTDDFLQGALPTMDTRTVGGEPAGQLVLMGTAGNVRAGLFWDTLEDGRAGLAGICEYAVPDETPLHDDEREYVAGTTSDPEVWKIAHPGIGTLTPLASIENNFNTLTPVKFAQDYLGLWPEGRANSFINAVKWDKAALSGPIPAFSRSFSLAFAVDHERRASTIAAAYRDKDGKAHMWILEQFKGVYGVAKTVAEISEKYRVPIAFDFQSAAAASVAEELKRMTPRPVLNPLVWAEVSTGAATIMALLDTDGLRHYDQPELNEAVSHVKKRQPVGASRWTFGELDNQIISAVAACNLALIQADTQPVRQPLGAVTLAPK